jgi:hypothetical protein
MRIDTGRLIRTSGSPDSIRQSIIFVSVACWAEAPLAGPRLLGRAPKNRNSLAGVRSRQPLRHLSEHR